MNYCDYNTSNKSFLDMHLYLKSINISNNNFMLLINDTDLIGIDPFDPYLSKELQRKIIKECQNNIWYFFREIIRIPNMGGGTGRYVLNKSDCAQTFCFLINWVSAPRGLRKTTHTDCILLWADAFFENNKEKIISRNKTISISEINRINCIRKCLPQYLQLSNNIIDSTNIPSDKSGAVNLGQSLKYNIIYYNEAEYIPYIRDIFSSSKTAFLNLKMKNFVSNKIIPFGILFESVYSDDADKNGALEILNSSIKWKDDFYDNVPIANYDKIIHVEHHYDELDADEYWFTIQCKLLNNDQETINREILLIRNKK